jgi:hypothetical protein
MEKTQSFDHITELNIIIYEIAYTDHTFRGSATSVGSGDRARLYHNVIWVDHNQHLH